MLYYNYTLSVNLVKNHLPHETCILPHEMYLQLQESLYLVNCNPRKDSFPCPVSSTEAYRLFSIPAKFRIMNYQLVSVGAKCLRLLSISLHRCKFHYFLHSRLKYFCRYKSYTFLITQYNQALPTG